MFCLDPDRVLCMGQMFPCWSNGLRQETQRFLFRLIRLLFLIWIGRGLVSPRFEYFLLAAVSGGRLLVYSVDGWPLNPWALNQPFKPSLTGGGLVDLQGPDRSKQDADLPFELITPIPGRLDLCWSRWLWVLTHQSVVGLGIRGQTLCVLLRCDLSALIGWRTRRMRFSWEEGPTLSQREIFDRLKRL